MNRRSFIAGIGALVGGIAIEQAIPFNRVWSFPRQIVVCQPVCTATIGQYADFISISDLFCSVMDDAVLRAAEQLGYRAALNLNQMMELCQ